MRRVLLLLPLLVVPPSLVAAYFVYLVPAARVQATETVGTPEANGQAARTAFERASRLLTQARAGNGQEKELLQQAAIEYRVCLAYETGTTAGTGLFDDARRNLAASRLLLVQHDRPPVAEQPRQTGVVRATPAPVQPSPIERAKAKPEPSSRQITARSREPEAESHFAASGKPLAQQAPAEQRPEPTRPVVGPDGVTYEQVDRSQGTGSPPR